LTSRRDALADTIKSALNDAAFSGKPFTGENVKQWLEQGKAILTAAANLPR
jgi:hypothetical protein